MGTPDQPAAAPPDDAGHQGSATLPQDTLTTGGEGDGPPLNQDSSREVGTAPASKAPGWISVVLLLLLGLVFYILMRG